MKQSRMLAVLVLLTLGACGSQASPFDPHVQPVGSNSPFFEGWFTKINDFHQNLSFAVIFGSFQPPQWSLASEFKFKQHWVAFLYFNLTSGATFTDQIVFYEQGVPGSELVTSPYELPLVEEDHVTITKASTGAFITTDPDVEAPVDFVWTSPKYGIYDVRDNVTQARFKYGQVDLNFTTDGRRPFSLQEPNADGPEGLMRHFSYFLPCHYAVHSMGSPTVYDLKIGEQDVVSGSGLAHMETNYGDLFPVGWVWSQGFSSDGSSAFVMTGGQFIIAGITTNTWILSYRSANFEVDFRTTQLDTVDREYDACNAVINITATSAFRDVKVTMFASLPNSDKKQVSKAFSDPLFFPTMSGFSNNPGCVESYQGIAEFRVYTKTSDSSFFWPKYVLAETVVMPGSALEFGGSDICSSDA